MEEQSLKKQLADLNIISFDCNGLATKSDVLKSLDAIRNHISSNSDKDAIAHIKRLQEEKNKRKFKGNIE